MHWPKLALFTSRSPTSHPVITLQIVLLGDANVGKSSIVTRFITEQFDAEIKNTVGAAFVTKTVETDDGVVVKFQIWDTAGQGFFKKSFLEVLPKIPLSHNTSVNAHAHECTFSCATA